MKKNVPPVRIRVINESSQLRRRVRPSNHYSAHALRLPVPGVFVFVCVCVCMFTCVCMMQCLQVPEYISRCVQSGAGLQLYIFCPPPMPAPPVPPLAPLKWQFVKHGPLLALSLASQPFPARLLPSLIRPPPSLLSPPRTTRFTSFPHFYLPPPDRSLSPLISIPPMLPASSLPVYLPLSFGLFSLSLSLSLFCPSQSVRFFFFIISASCLLCPRLLLHSHYLPLPVRPLLHLFYEFHIHIYIYLFYYFF